MLKKILEELMNRYRKVRTDEDLEWNRAVDMCSDIIRKHMNEGKDTNVPTNDGWIPVEIAPPPIGQRLQATIKHHKWIADYDTDWVPEEEKTVHEERLEVCEITNVGGQWFFCCEEDEYQSDVAYIAPEEDLSKPISEIIAWRKMLEPYRPKKGEANGK